MIGQKYTTKIVAVLMAAAVLLCLLAVAFSDQITARAGDPGVSMEYETALFDTDSIMTVNIRMDEDEWNEMLENAMSEEYYSCDVEINGTTFCNVGIRPKGNTSLSSIASDPTTDRYSFKLEFDHYVEGQTCFGLDKLILNNNYADATCMKEALVYDMYQYLGADASLYNYAKISVNGTYWGVYLALEGVEDSFLLRNYGVQNGELYKPEGMNMGGGGGMPQPGNRNDGEFPQNQDEEDSEEVLPAPENPKDEADRQAETSEQTENVSQTEKPDPERSQPEKFEKGDFEKMDFPGDGFGAGSGGADLSYTDDDLDSYETIWDGEVTETGRKDHKRVVTALKNISEGNNLEEYMDVDNLLRYMAVHIFSVNEDSLSGNMAHNYYLYESGGQLNLIPWDYNLAFGGMSRGSDAESVVNSAIDDAFSGTDFFDTLMEDETYHSRYYAYLQQLVSDYVNGGAFDAFYERVRSQIDELVETDPTAFYTCEEYQEAADTLYQLVKLRGESIQKQLDGTIPSTKEAQQGSDALVDASALDLGVMGSMNTGGEHGDRGHGGRPEFSDAGEEENLRGNGDREKTADAPERPGEKKTEVANGSQNTP